MYPGVSGPEFDDILLRIPRHTFSLSPSLWSPNVVTFIAGFLSYSLHSPAASAVPGTLAGAWWEAVMPTSKHSHAHFIEQAALTVLR